MNKIPLRKTNTVIRHIYKEVHPKWWTQIFYKLYQKDFSHYPAELLQVIPELEALNLDSLRYRARACWKEALTDHADTITPTADRLYHVYCDTFAARKYCTIATIPLVMNNPICTVKITHDDGEVVEGVNVPLMVYNVSKSEFSLQAKALRMNIASWRQLLDNNSISHGNGCLWEPDSARFITKFQGRYDAVCPKELVTLYAFLYTGAEKPRKGTKSVSWGYAMRHSGINQRDFFNKEVLRRIAITTSTELLREREEAVKTIRNIIKSYL